MSVLSVSRKVRSIYQCSRTSVHPQHTLIRRGDMTRHATKFRLTKGVYKTVQGHKYEGLTEERVTFILIYFPFSLPSGALKVRLPGARFLTCIAGFSILRSVVGVFVACRLFP
jgi:hypothetical protein